MKKEFIFVGLVVLLSILVNIVPKDIVYTLVFIIMGILILGLIIAIIIKLIIVYKIHKYGKTEEILYQFLNIENADYGKLSNVITNGIINTEDKESFLKDVAVEVVFKDKLNITIDRFNNYLRKLNYDFVISLEDIYSYDDEFIKKRRQNGVSTLIHDLNIILNLLSNKKFEMFYVSGDKTKCYYVIIPFENIELVKEICDEESF